MDFNNFVNSQPEEGLRIGSGKKSDDNWNNLDIRDIDGVDIVHNILHVPWPIDNNKYNKILARDVFEHIPHTKTYLSNKPAQEHYPSWFQSVYKQNYGGYLNIYDIDPMLPIMEEIGRILQPGGFLALQFPIPNEFNDLNDPTHCRQLTPTLFQHWMPKSEHGQRWYGKSFDTDISFTEITQNKKGNNYRIILRLSEHK